MAALSKLGIALVVHWRIGQRYRATRLSSVRKSCSIQERWLGTIYNRGALSKAVFSLRERLATGWQGLRGKGVGGGGGGGGGGGTATQAVSAFLRQVAGRGHCTACCGHTHISPRRRGLLEKKMCGIYDLRIWGLRSGAMMGIEEFCL